MSTPTITYIVRLENIYSVGLSLTRQPLEFDLDEHFDLLQLRFGNHTLPVTSKNRNMLLEGLVIGASKAPNGNGYTEVIYTEVGHNPYHVENLQTDGDLNFLGLLQRAKYLYYSDRKTT